MAVFKKGDKWVAQAYLNGRRIGSKTFALKRDAEKWEEDQRRKGTKAPSRRTVGDLLEEYQRLVTPTKDGKKWEHARINYFLQTDLAKLPATCTTPDLVKWRDKRLEAVTGATVERDMNLLSNVFRVAWKEWHWLAGNPWSDVKRPKAALARDRIVKPAEVAALRLVSGDTCATVIGRSVYLFRFCIETGMRVGEALAMRKENLHGSYVHVPALLEGERKSKKRDVPLSPEAQAILKDVLELGFDVWGLTESQREKNFAKAVERAALEDLHFHDSRHTAITNLAKHLTVLELARMVGHRDLNMLLVYYNESAASIAERLAAAKS